MLDRQNQEEHSSTKKDNRDVARGGHFRISSLFHVNYPSLLLRDCTRFHPEEQLQR